MAARKTARSTGSKHDDFYTRLRERVSAWTKKSSINPKYRDYVLALPDLFHLVVKLTMDKRVDAKSKAVLGAAVAWAIVPLDILPDFLGPLGMLDDLLVLVLALDFMLDRTPRHVVEEHWAGTGDIFALIRNVLDRADEWMGRGLYNRIRGMVERKVKPGPAKANASAPAAKASPKGRVTKAKSTAGTSRARLKAVAAKSKAVPAAKVSARRKTAPARAKAAPARTKAAPAAKAPARRKATRA